MSAQYTPGPWVVDYSHPDWVEGTTIWANDVVIAHAVADQHHQTEANARLISAAPELLAALQDMVGAYQRHFDVMPVAWQTYDDIARAAIAKATGAE